MILFLLLCAGWGVLSLVVFLGWVLYVLAVVLRHPGWSKAALRGLFACDPVFTVTFALVKVVLLSYCWPLFLLRACATRRTRARITRSLQSLPQVRSVRWQRVGRGGEWVCDVELLPAPEREEPGRARRAPKKSEGPPIP